MNIKKSYREKYFQSRILNYVSCKHCSQLFSEFLTDDFLLYNYSKLWVAIMNAFKIEIVNGKKYLT